MRFQFFTALLALSLATAGRVACHLDLFADQSERQGSEAPKRAALPTADLQTLFAKGQAALSAGDLDLAEANFREVASRDPKSAAAYANLGVVAMRRKDWDHALALLKKAERLEPRMAGVRLNIGFVKYPSGGYFGAHAPLASVGRDQPGCPPARDLPGQC